MLASREDRNRDIARRYAQGDLLRVIAAAFGLSTQRVSQIVQDSGLPSRIDRPASPGPAVMRDAKAAASSLLAAKRALACEVAAGRAEIAEGLARKRRQDAVARGDANA